MLTGKDIEAYVPLVKTMRQWSDRKKKVELPLMNGYVFVKIMPADNDKVMQTRGVVSFVRSEGKIAVIRDVEIDRLKQLVELGFNLEARTVHSKYSPGDKVKIGDGVLKGIEGYVVEDHENRYIEVLLESIGQCIKVKLPRELIFSA